MVKFGWETLRSWRLWCAGMSGLPQAVDSEFTEVFYYRLRELEEPRIHQASAAGAPFNPFHEKISVVVARANQAKFWLSHLRTKLCNPTLPILSPLPPPCVSPHVPLSQGFFVLSGFGKICVWLTLETDLTLLLGVFLTFFSCSLVWLLWSFYDSW